IVAWKWPASSGTVRALPCVRRRPRPRAAAVQRRRTSHPASEVRVAFAPVAKVGPGGGGQTSGAGEHPGERGQPAQILCGDDLAGEERPDSEDACERNAHDQVAGVDRMPPGAVRVGGEAWGPIVEDGGFVHSLLLLLDRSGRVLVA